MSDTQEFQEIVAKLRDFGAAEYQRGERDAIERILRAARASEIGEAAEQKNRSVVATEVDDSMQARGEIKERARLERQKHSCAAFWPASPQRGSLLTILKLSP